jgi:serine/threonine-protein kinase RsbT
VRQRVRAYAAELGLKLIAQTKIVTAASELARNTVIYGGGGTALIEIAETGNRRGVRLTLSDSGPGIPDIKLAMSDGYTTGGGLGMGLGGSKRLCDEFEIWSMPGEGTRIVVTTWR